MGSAAQHAERSTVAAAGDRPRPPRESRPLRDNPRLILLGILLLLVALIAMVAVADRSAELAPDFLSEVVLSALLVADLTMLVALVFVLARNVIKLWVERRRALPFARFRAKLVAALLGMTIVPAVLVLIVGSEVIRSSVDRWFSEPVDEILASATRIASEYYHERETLVAAHAGGLADALRQVNLSAVDARAVQGIIQPTVQERRLALVEVYRIVPGAGDRRQVLPLTEAVARGLPTGSFRTSSDQLAWQVAMGSSHTRTLQAVGGGGELLRVAALVTGPGEAEPVGVVVASDYLTGEVARQSRRIIDAYEGYSQLRVFKRPLAGVYLSFFLMLSLMILVSASWMGLYLAKRITGHVQRLADGAREIGAGHLDHRIERETNDEFGGLVDAFNTMAEELSASQRRLEESTRELEQKNLEVEARRRYFQTILERIATGVVSIDAAGRLITVNAAAMRLLDLPPGVQGRSAGDVVSRPDLKPVAALLRDAVQGAGATAGREIALARDGREIHLAAAATQLSGDAGQFKGLVLVFDDVTPLIHTQRVAAWRDVARRLAHEIKNPLTPIQLCADRLRRHFRQAAPQARALVEECTGTIVGEVESLKELVDEFAQFARMPAPRTVPTDLHDLLQDVLTLYSGLFQGIRIERAFAPDLPLVRVDPEQIRRVIINLVDNAVEALRGSNGGPPVRGDHGVIEIATQHDTTNRVARIVVADNGPGLPEADREKLFLPYYSTKQRGSGLGLAIVRRIVAEHGGSIEAHDNVPAGTRFTIELPC
jgi:two-component system, NtrC family, nitrogen regulation sensor histidine kinase NtrY